MNNNVKLRVAVVFLWDCEAEPCLGKNTPSMTVLEETPAVAPQMQTAALIKTVIHQFCQKHLQLMIERGN